MAMADSISNRNLFYQQVLTYWWYTYEGRGGEGRGGEAWGGEGQGGEGQGGEGRGRGKKSA
jgi:hypothetical protein